MPDFLLTSWLEVVQYKLRDATRNGESVNP